MCTIHLRWQLSSYPAGAAAGSCFLLVSSSFFLYPAGAAAGSCIWLVVLPAQPQDFVFLSCRRSRRILFLTRFLYRRIHMRLYTVFLWFFFLLLSSFFCQPYNLMYLPAVLIDFNETWSQWLMTQPAYVIWPMTGSKVIQCHRGQKGHFSPKTHQVLRIMQRGPVTYVCSSPWPTLQMLLDHFFIWGHLGSQRSNIRSESKYL